MGFIFYKPSPRNVTLPTLPKMPSAVQRVGVFVDATLDFIVEKASRYQFDILQLHGRETPDFCKQIQETLRMPIWKVFSVGDHFDFGMPTAYEAFVDAFLFDTEGRYKGGNGIAFDWRILKDYQSEKPLVLSGGIGLETLDDLRKIKKTKLPILAVDVNSRFETVAGLKDVSLLQEFVNQLNKI